MMIKPTSVQNHNYIVLTRKQLFLSFFFSHTKMLIITQRRSWKVSWKSTCCFKVSVRLCGPLFPCESGGNSFQQDPRASPDSLPTSWESRCCPLRPGSTRFLMVCLFLQSVLSTLPSLRDTSPPPEKLFQQFNCINKLSK